MSIERLENRFEHYLCKLRAAWSNDPTVETSFRSDFNALMTHLEQGDTTNTRAAIALTELYKSHLPSELKPQSHHVHLPNKSRSVSAIAPLGQFYRLVVAGVWQAISAPLQGSCGHPQRNAYGEPAKRSVWLTYTRGARQAH